jgi:hypothetical protein
LFAVYYCTQKDVVEVEELFSAIITDGWGTDFLLEPQQTVQPVGWDE